MNYTQYAPISNKASVCSVSGKISISTCSDLTPLPLLLSNVKNRNNLDKLITEYAECAKYSSTASFNTRNADVIWGDIRVSIKKIMKVYLYLGHGQTMIHRDDIWEAA